MWSAINFAQCLPTSTSTYSTETLFGEGLHVSHMPVLNVCCFAGVFLFLLLLLPMHTETDRKRMIDRDRKTNKQTDGHTDITHSHIHTQTHTDKQTHTHTHTHTHTLRSWLHVVLQWGGLMLIYLLGQRNSFDAFNFVHTWLNIVETGVKTATTSGDVSVDSCTKAITPSLLPLRCAVLCCFE